MFTVIGYCPKCGAPIYVPNNWQSITPPPNTYSCNCNPQPKTEIRTNTKETFRKELEHLINSYSLENASNTPDFILAEYMMSCLNIFATAVQQRETWYGREGIFCTGLSVGRTHE